jgi:hypothetical protein
MSAEQTARERLGGFIGSSPHSPFYKMIFNHPLYSQQRVDEQ